MKQEQSKKILLIDGHSILNRAFFGLPDLTNTAGLHTNAVYGFLNIMFKFIETEKPGTRGLSRRKKDCFLPAYAI